MEKPACIGAASIGLSVLGQHDIPVKKKLVQDILDLTPIRLRDFAQNGHIRRD